MSKKHGGRTKPLKVASMYKELVKDATSGDDPDWTIEYTSHHVRLRHRDGGFVSLGCTPSDKKSVLAIRSQMKKGGLKPHGGRTR